MAVFPTNLVADDYGPRRLGGNLYDWHGGVDYNSQENGENGNGDRGDALIALEGGTVDWSINGCYKWIGINGINHDFGYGHIFRSSQNVPQQSGGFWIRRQSPPTQFELAIILPNGTAIGQVAGMVNHDGDATTPDIGVNTMVNAGTK